MMRYDVAIVGGGFSGCAVAAQLARTSAADLSLALFEPGDLGRGAAYGTPHAELLLNTRAQAMSAFGDDPQHFVRWLGGRAKPADFASRRLYGEYLNDTARQTFARPNFAAVRNRIAAIERTGDGFVLETATGTRLRANAVVLATGNPLPEDDFLPRGVREHPGYVADPWRCDYRRIGGHVLLIGSGLTALDALVALEACGHRGSVHVVSRHGRFPQAHAENVRAYDAAPAIDARSALAALRSVRRHVRDAIERGFDWRAVVDAIRPETETLWRRLPPAERARFERHLRGTWERHRHRAPGSIDAVRTRYRASRRFACSLGEIAAADNGNVEVRLRDGGREVLRPDWIVNCTGAGRARRAMRDPLFAGLLAGGLVAPEPLGYGLHVLVPGLWAIGPLLRGVRFEATAVPELRAMAQTIAAEVGAAARPELTLTG